MVDRRVPGFAGKRRPDLLVALAWDQSSRPSFSIAADLMTPSSDQLGFSVPGFERSASNLLDDVVAPAFSAANRVLALWSTNDPLWIVFQVGLAAGLERPVRVVGSRGEVEAAFGLPVDVKTADIGTATIRETAAESFERAPQVEFSYGQILLCPGDTPEDRATLGLLEPRLGGRVHRRIGELRSREPAVDDVVWVITKYGVAGPTEHNLRSNIGNAFEAGRCYGSSLRHGAEPQLTIIRNVFAPPIAALDHLTRVATDPKAVADLFGAPVGGALRLIGVELLDLKCFPSISVPISISSALGGAWTCIAGVNGAGKSTILQSIALGLLGRSSAPELGLARLARMVRQDDSTSAPTAEIRLTLSDGSMTGEIVLPLGEKGIDERALASMSDRSTMEQIWDRTNSMLIVGYGATRNVSDTLTGASSMQMSSAAQRLLTLFDPLGQITSTEALVAGGPRFEPMLRTVAKLVTKLLDEPGAPFRCEVRHGRLVFQRGNASLGSLDLPDGFRSILALLADIAAGWHEINPEAADVDPATITGIVLVDELDLHLHARLQREIVPRLRAALSGMQWIVTTHSPFIVGSFDQSELVLLDQTQPGGIRKLDRQVLAFTTNDINDWLLDASPVSLAGEQAVMGESGAALLYQSPSRSANEAESLLARQDELLARLRDVKA